MIDSQCNFVRSLLIGLRYGYGIHLCRQLLWVPFVLFYLMEESCFAKGIQASHKLSTEGMYLDKPDDDLIYAVDQQYIWRNSFRESLSWRINKLLKFEFSGYLVSLHLSNRDDLDHYTLLFIDPRNRSTGLDFFLLKNEKSDLFAIVDHLYAKTRLGPVRLSVGRFPIELTKGYIFRPNDLFGSSQYNNLDLSQKRGVDGMQMSGPIGALGEWQVYGVLGYEEAVPAEMGFDGVYTEPKNTMSTEQLSLIGIYMDSFFDYSVRVGGGMFRKTYLVLGSVEGDLTTDLALRAEFKQVSDIEDELMRFSGMLGLDYRLNPDNLLFAEVYSNGYGLASIEEYSEIESSAYKPLSNTGLLYLGLGASSDLTPLLTFRSASQINLTDSSASITNTLNYSVGAHLDFSGAMVVTMGDPPFDGDIYSEFGAFPTSLTLSTILRW